MASKNKVTDDQVDEDQIDENVETDQEDDDSGESDGKVRKKEIYDHVTVTTGLRRREVREAVDATLAYFHKCLAEGKDLQIPPLGKIRSISRGEGENAKLMHKVMLQSPKSEKKDDAEGKEPLADTENAD